VIVENASRSAAVMRNGPSRSWEGGGCDHDGQQQSAGVDRDVPLAALDLLPPVVPAAGGRDGVGGADGLGVDHGRGRHGATPVGQRGTFTQRCVDPAPRPRADLHLFQAKREGRNRIVFDGAEAPKPAGDRQLSLYE
jgi:hypothetical protein